MKKHADALSNTTIKRIIGGKYKPEASVVSFTNPPKKETQYEKRPCGWRKVR